MVLQCPYLCCGQYCWVGFTPYSQLGLHLPRQGFVHTNTLYHWHGLEELFWGSTKAATGKTMLGNNFDGGEFEPLIITIPPNQESGLQWKGNDLPHIIVFTWHDTIQWPSLATKHVLPIFQSLFSVKKFKTKSDQWMSHQHDNCWYWACKWNYSEWFKCVRNYCRWWNYTDIKVFLARGPKFTSLQLFLMGKKKEGMP